MDILWVIIVLLGALIGMVGYVINIMRIRQSNVERYIRTLEEGEFMDATVRTVVNLIKAKVNEDNTVIHTSMASLERSVGVSVKLGVERDKAQDKLQSQIDKAQNERIDKLDKTIRDGIQNVINGQQKLSERIDNAYSHGEGDHTKDV